MLEQVRKEETEIEEEWLTPAEEKWWQKAEELWRFLKRFTTGETKSIVTSVSADNGWETWRRLHVHCEPGSVVREAMVMANFTSMVTKRAKNYAETKKMMTEFDERAKRVEETTRKKPDQRHAMSVLVGILDFETLKHTSAHQGQRCPWRSSRERP